MRSELLGEQRRWIDPTKYTVKHIVNLVIGIASITVTYDRLTMIHIWTWIRYGRGEIFQTLHRN